MRLLDFLKSKAAPIAIFLFIDCFMALLLWVYSMNAQGILFACAVLALAFIAALIIEYLPKRKYYNQVEETLSSLDKKCLLAAFLDEPEFYEGRIFSNCVETLSKAMNDEIAQYKTASKEYREYIELWIHEVKTPIASSRLILENNPSPTANGLGEELDAIDYYLEQALFYSRSTDVQKDYIIKETGLFDVVNQVIRRNARHFIRDKIGLELEKQDITVFTDEKWLEYMLNQIVVNSIKYRREEGAAISIYAQERQNAVSLFIRDNGIGISRKDIGRVFEKGYTGITGREYKKATGIGLYLVKKLSDKLGLSVGIVSEEGKGTTLELVFPKTDLADLTKS